MKYTTIEQVINAETKIKSKEYNVRQLEHKFEMHQLNKEYSIVADELTKYHDFTSYINEITKSSLLNYVSKNKIYNKSKTLSENILDNLLESSEFKKFVIEFCKHNENHHYDAKTAFMNSKSNAKLKAEQFLIYRLNKRYATKNKVNQVIGFEILKDFQLFLDKNNIYTDIETFTEIFENAQNVFEKASIDFNVNNMIDVLENQCFIFFTDKEIEIINEFKIIYLKSKILKAIKDQQELEISLFDFDYNITDDDDSYLALLESSINKLDIKNKFSIDTNNKDLINFIDYEISRLINDVYDKFLEYKKNK